MVPASAAITAHPKENVPSATKKPPKGRMTSAGIGATPIIETTIRARSPGSPIAVITVVMISMTDPISENVTFERLPAPTSGRSSRPGRRSEEEAERTSQLAIGPGGDAVELEGILATAAGDDRALPTEGDGEGDPDFDLARPLGRLLDRPTKLREERVAVRRRFLLGHRERNTGRPFNGRRSARVGSSGGLRAEEAEARAVRGDGGGEGADLPLAVPARGGGGPLRRSNALQ